MQNYILLENDIIVGFWEDPINKGWTEEQIQKDIIGIGGILTTKNIVYGYDGRFYFEGSAPVMPEEERREQQNLLIDSTVQNKLDEFARQRDFKDIATAISYTNSTQPTFAQDAKVCLEVRDEAWKIVYDMRNKELKGARYAPSLEDILVALPSMNWADYV